MNIIVYKDNYYLIRTKQIKQDYFKAGYFYDKLGKTLICINNKLLFL